MRRDLLRLAVIAALLIAAFAVAAGYYIKSERIKKEQVAEKTRQETTLVFERPHSRSLGPTDAKVTIVEFLDPECEACRAMYPIVKRLLAQYEGRVRLVVRYMPFHPNSVYAAGVLEAAGEQGRYWEMLETLFQYQPQWGSHHAPRPDLIPSYAEQIGLDMQALETAVNAGAHKGLVEIDAADGRALGVTATPAFFVNGRPLGRLGYEPLRALIDEELSK
ncbi:MAG: thioredoxin domain-containing protein [Myxococcota bacterium]